jgi:Outer membrane lipoprotein-sorting protein
VKVSFLNHVPKEHSKIARHFNAGSICGLYFVPKGRAKEEKCRFSRPFGTSPASRLFPALKRRAIFKKSLRDCVLFAFTAMILFFAFGARAETTNDLSDAEIKGRNLAQQLADVRPTENFTNTGTLKIKDAKGKSSEILIKFLVVVEATNWLSIYEGAETNSETGDKLRIIHQESLANKYAIVHVCGPRTTLLQLDDWGVSPLSDEAETTMPFCRSDFWLADLGLEFFHWPAQKILKKEVHRSRGCTVLESTNQNPSTNGYSRVVSWIDEESLGIVEAYAYDANGKLLKDFYPKDFKKVDGQWQVQTLVMENVQTGSRSRLEFDLNKP